MPASASKYASSAKLSSTNARLAATSALAPMLGEEGAGQRCPSLQHPGGLPHRFRHGRNEGEHASVVDDGHRGAWMQVVLLPEVGGNHDPALLGDGDRHWTS